MRRATGCATMWSRRSPLARGGARQRRDRLPEAGGGASRGVARRYTGSGRAGSPTAGSARSPPARPGTAMPSSTAGPDLPQGWASAPERRAAALIERASAADVPFARVAADGVHGVGGIEARRSAARARATCPASRASASVLVAGQAPERRRHGRGDRRGGAGLRPGAPVGRRGHPGTEAPRPGVPGARRPHRRRARIGGARRLDARAPHPARRRRREPRLLLLDPWCPAGTPVEAPVAVEGRRRAIEDAFEAAKAASSGWPATRRAPGTAGTATSRPSCRRSPCPPRSVTAPTARHPRKAGRPTSSAAGALVRPGDPARRHAAAGPAADRARLHHRLVDMATMPPAHRTAGSPQAQGATVVLVVRARSSLPVWEPHARGKSGCELLANL
jgi:hypothetical protein